MLKMQKHDAIPYSMPRLSDAERIGRATAFRDRLSTRRSCRSFSDAPIPREVIEAAIEAAGTAPSGANHQPWHFAVVSSPENKRAIREAAAPMGFLREICGRPEHEKPLMIIVVGQPSEDATVPAHAVKKKPFSQISSWL